MFVLGVLFGGFMFDMLHDTTVFDNSHSAWHDSAHTNHDLHTSLNAYEDVLSNHEASLDSNENIRLQTLLGGIRVAVQQCHMLDSASLESRCLRREVLPQVVELLPVRIEVPRLSSRCFARLWAGSYVENWARGKLRVWAEQVLLAAERERMVSQLRVWGLDVSSGRSELLWFLGWCERRRSWG